VIKAEKTNRKKKTAKGGGRWFAPNQSSHLAKLPGDISGRFKIWNSKIRFEHHVHSFFPTFVAINWLGVSSMLMDLMDFHGDSDMMPWIQLRHPFLGRMWTDLTSEFTQFNLVIRLSKVKQSAIPFSTFCNVSPLLLSLRQLGTFIFTLAKPIRTARNLFFRWCSCFWCNMQHDRWSRQVHAFQVCF